MFGTQVLFANETFPACSWSVYMRGAGGLAPVVRIPGRPWCKVPRIFCLHVSYFICARATGVPSATNRSATKTREALRK